MDSLDRGEDASVALRFQQERAFDVMWNRRECGEGGGAYVLLGFRREASMWCEIVCTLFVERFVFFVSLSFSLAVARDRCEAWVRREGTRKEKCDFPRLRRAGSRRPGALETFWGHGAPYLRSCFNGQTGVYVAARILSRGRARTFIRSEVTVAADPNAKSRTPAAPDLGAMFHAFKSDRQYLCTRTRNVSL